MSGEVFFFRILSILTHTHTHEERRGLKETDSGVYPKGPFGEKVVKFISG